MFSFFRSMNKPHRVLLFTCFFAFFSNGSTSLLLGAVLPDLEAVYQLSPTVRGMLLSAHSLGNLIAGFVAGLVPLWLGQRRSIVLLASLACIGLLMMILWGNPLWLLAAFLFTGMGRGSVTNFDNRMVNLISGGSPAASNLLHCSFAVGAITTPLTFLLLRTVFSWQAGMSYVIICVAISVILFSRMHLENDMPDRTDKVNSAMTFLKNPSFLILAGMMFCYLCSEYAINGWLVTYIQNKENLLSSGITTDFSLDSYSQAMSSLMWGVMLIGRLACAFLSSRINQKKLMMFSAFGAVLFYFLMLRSASVGMVTVSVAGLGLCMAGICPMIYSDAAIFTNTYPMATSTLLAIGSSGAILMPTLVGSLAEAFGFSGGMSAIFFTFVLLMIFATLNVLVKTRKPV